MQTTARLLAPGLAKRSLEEAKKFAKLGIHPSIVLSLFVNVRAGANARID